MIYQIKSSLHSLSNPQKALILQRFFKTGKGQYGEGDIFLGITVPEVREIAKKYWKEVNLKDLTELLHSKIHEERSLALYVLVDKFEKSKDKKEQEEIINFYIKPENVKWINNWDLVDLSCYKILGKYLFENQDKINILYDFAKSENLWIKRIAIISTFAFIKEKQFQHTIKICQVLLNDKHHLIHKATGWMLREIGKRDKQILVNFLDKNHTKMARISVSYATEKLNKEQKILYKLRKCK